MPVHFRYQPPSSIDKDQTHVPVELAFPNVYMRCSNLRPKEERSEFPYDLTLNFINDRIMPVKKKSTSSASDGLQWQHVPVRAPVEDRLIAEIPVGQEQHTLPSLCVCSWGG